MKITNINYSDEKSGAFIAVKRINRILNKYNIKFETRNLGTDLTREELLEISPNARTMPQILIGSTVIGGYTELIKYVEDTGFNGTGWG